jgi:hypothetical protein
LPKPTDETDGSFYQRMARVLEKKKKLLRNKNKNIFEAVFTFKKSIIYVTSQVNHCAK